MHWTVNTNGYEQESNKRVGEMDPRILCVFLCKEKNVGNLVEEFYSHCRRPSRCRFVCNPAISIILYWKKHVCYFDYDGCCNFFSVSD